jgi:hypothetical protein
MSKRKTTIDKAIENLDQKIAHHLSEVEALRLARAHLVEQQTEQRGHPEGGRGI